MECRCVQKMYLLMELCDGGDLCSLLRSHGPFSEDETRVVVEQLTRAVSYLHRHGITTLRPLCYCVAPIAPSGECYGGSCGPGRK